MAAAIKVAESHAAGEEPAFAVALDCLPVMLREDRSNKHMEN